MHVAAHRMKALAHAAIHSVQVSFPTRLAHPSPCGCGMDNPAGTAMTADRKNMATSELQAYIPA